jgi:hypothetical protein
LIDNSLTVLRDNGYSIETDIDGAAPQAWSSEYSFGHPLVYDCGPLLTSRGFRQLSKKIDSRLDSFRFSVR